MSLTARADLLALVAVGLVLHLLACLVALALGAALLPRVGGWLARDESGQDGWAAAPSLTPWPAALMRTRALLRKQPGLTDASGPLTRLCHAGAVVLSTAALLLLPGFAVLWPSGAGGDMVLVIALLAIARLVSALPGLEGGIAADAWPVEAAVIVALRELALAGLVAFAATQIIGGSQFGLLGGLSRGGAATPGVLPLARLCLLTALVLLAAAALEAEPAAAQLSGPDLLLARLGPGLLRLGWLAMAALLMPPTAPVLSDWDRVLRAPLLGLLWLAKLAVLAVAAQSCVAWRLQVTRCQTMAAGLAILSALLMFLSGRAA